MHLREQPRDLTDSLQKYYVKNILKKSHLETKENSGKLYLQRFHKVL